MTKRIIIWEGEYVNRVSGEPGTAKHSMAERVPSREEQGFPPLLPATETFLLCFPLGVCVCLCVCRPVHLWSHRNIPVARAHNMHKSGEAG